MLGNLTDALEAVETARAIREANDDKEGVAWLLHSEAVILLQQAYERQVDDASSSSCNADDRGPGLLWP